LYLILCLKYLLEDVLEVTIVLFENGVLGSQHHRHLTVDGEFEGLMGEVCDRRVGVEHTHSASSLTFELVNGSSHWCTSVGGSEH
jgi:hypothetical protein